MNSKEYLVASSAGKKFEYTDLNYEEDGPFGDDFFDGANRQPIILEDTKQDPNYVEINLAFENREERSFLDSQSNYYRNLIVIATPRDPRGPFTLSVYQDFTLVGWLVGDDSEKLACYLVDTFDFGAAVFDTNFCLDIDDDEISFSTIYKLPTANEAKSNSSTPKAKTLLTWKDIDESIKLPRAISWEGASELGGTITSPEFAEKHEISDEELVYFRDFTITLVPDIWQPETNKTLIYVEGDFAGELTDPDESASYYQALTKSGVKVAHARNGIAYAEDGDCFIAINGELREICESIGTLSNRKSPKSQ